MLLGFISAFQRGKKVKQNGMGGRSTEFYILIKEVVIFDKHCCASAITYSHQGGVRTVCDCRK